MRIKTTARKNDVEEGGAISSDMALIYPVSILSGAVNRGARMDFHSPYVFLALTAFVSVPLGLALYF